MTVNGERLRRGGTAMTGLLTALVLALATPSLAVYRDYYLVNMLKNWTEAQTYCREKFVDLATMESAEDWARVQHAISASGQQDAWIGMYNDVMFWRWSLDDSYFYQGGTPMLDSSVVDLDSGSVEKHCGLIFTGQLLARECDRTRKSLCYDATTQKYVKVQTLKTWKGARKNCRNTYTDMATIPNMVEFNKVLGKINHNMDAWWVGLFREGWRWSDGSEATYRAWLTYPTGTSLTCGSADLSGWSHAACHLERPFVCSALRKKMIKLVVKTNGAVDLNDPLVQEAILKHAEKNLGRHGIQQQLRLSWKKQANGNVFNKTEL